MTSKWNFLTCRWLPLRWLRLACYVFCALFLVYLLNSWFSTENKPLILPWTGNDWRLRNVSLPFKDLQLSYRLFEPSQMEKNPCNRKRVVVFVETSPGHFDTRAMIRETWASEKSLPSDFLLLFLIGAQSDPLFELELRRESIAHSDIVRYDFQDSYRQLFLKTHVAFEWFRSQCPKANFLIKVDDDAVLHLARINKFIEKEANEVVRGKEETLFCNVQQGHHPFRNPFSKLYVPFTSYSSFTFPDYCQGGAYMASRQAVVKILDNTQLTYFVPLEDVLYTGILGQQIGLNLYATPAFCFETSKKCDQNNVPLEAAVCGVWRHEIGDEFDRLNSIDCLSFADNREINTGFLFFILLVNLIV